MLACLASSGLVWSGGLLMFVSKQFVPCSPIQNGENALYSASKTGQSQVAEFLINKGANVNEENKVCYNIV